MTTATTLLEQVAERSRRQLLVAVGAGDLAVEQARTALAQARENSRQLAVAVRPDTVVSTLANLVEQARTQATATVEQLADRGADRLEDLRRQPGFRRLAVRAEQAVDKVEDVVEDAIEETAEAVTEASNEVTSLVQKAASRTAKVAAQAETVVDEAADSAKAAIEETVEAADEATAEAARKPAKRTTAARGKAAEGTSARVTRPAKNGK